MNNSVKGFNLKSLAMLAALLLLTACDGGIFGTGGDPDMLPTIDSDVADSGSPPNASENTDGDDNATPAGTTGGDTGGDTGGSETDGGTGGTTSEGGAEGVTDGGTTGDGSTDSSEENMNSTADPENTPNAQFTNETAVLNSAEPRLSVVNASNLTLNVFESSVEPDSVLFDENGLAPQSNSSSVSLSNNESSLEFVNNNNLSELLGSYSQFDVAEATLSTVFVRQLDTTFFLDAVATQITTSDPGLAKVRVVQASALNNVTTNGQFMLLTTGAGSNGVDASFDPINFFAPVSPYLEVPAGDYELADAQARKDNEPISLTGGVVYTITVLGPGATPSLLNNDTALGN